jgi:hypothetical protein
MKAFWGHRHVVWADSLFVVATKCPTDIYVKPRLTDESSINQEQELAACKLHEGFCASTNRGAANASFLVYKWMLHEGFSAFVVQSIRTLHGVYT